MPTSPARPSSAPAHPAAEVEHYLEELAALPPTPSARRRQIEQIVVVHHLGLADRIASHYLGRGIDRDDLLQVARLGLVKAVRRYQPGQGDSFAAFASPTIAGELKRHFRDAGWMVRPPRRLQELGARLRYVELELEQRLQRPPTAVEIAEAMEVPLPEVRESRLAAMGFRPQSLDAPPSGVPAGSASSEWGSWAADLDSDEAFERIERDEWLAGAVGQLAAREQLILRLRFVDGLTQAEIGGRLGVSQMQISRILRTVLTRLRTVLSATSGAVA